MKLSLNSLFSAAVLAAVIAPSLASQVAIPPHSSVYNGFSRGYSFTANTDFFINKLDLPLDAFQAGDTASYRVGVNGVEVLISVGNAGAITPLIQIQTGDLVSVVGNWSPVATSNFSAHNSYGSRAPFSTMIEGVAHTLDRAGWQWDIGDPGYTGASGFTGLTGSIGRVYMHTQPPSGLFAKFSGTPLSGPAPLAVTFTDSSFSSDPGGILAWAWDFDNDGTVDSIAQNPPAVMYAGGAWGVRLDVFDNLHGQSTETKLNYVTVGAPKADFTYAVAGCAVVVFTDTSTSATAWAWDFTNDGTVDQVIQNPVHDYVNNGAYDCKLEVTGAIPTQKDSIVKNVSIGLGSLSTIYAQNNGGNIGGAVYFDVTINSAITITTIDTNYSAAVGAPVGIQVHVGAQGATYVGNQTNLTFWGTPVAVDNGASVSAGTNAPSNITLQSSLTLTPGVYPMALVAVGSAHRYTNGNGTNQSYSNADLKIDLGSATNAPFTGTIFNPRVWNGGFNYVPSASNENYGSSLASGVGPAAPTMSASASTPLLGGTLTLSITQNDSPALGFLLAGAGRGPLALPWGNLDIGFIVLGQPLGIMPVGTPVQIPFPVPNNCVLAGVQINWVNVNVDPVAGPFGTGWISWSNGVESTLR